MAITMVLDVPGATQEQYDEIIEGLEQAGLAKPAGRLLHVAAPKPKGWFVCDVWDSQESFDRFAGTLVPLLGRVGLGEARPAIMPVHNVVIAE